MKERIIGLLSPEGPGCLRDVGLLALRLGPLLMFVNHGTTKLLSFSALRAQGFADPIHVGPTMSLILVLFAEFFCTGLLVLGAATRLAAFFPLFTMLVAGVLVVEGGLAARELPLLYAVVYLAILCAGPGRWSVDRFLAERLGAS